MLNKDTANEALKYKNILRETTYNSLISKIKKHDIDKVFIIGKGPQRAMELLNLSTKTHKINKIKLKNKILRYNNFNSNCLIFRTISIKIYK
jgi:hypothetical protein